MLPVVIID